METMSAWHGRFSFFATLFDGHGISIMFNACLFDARNFYKFKSLWVILLIFAKLWDILVHCLSFDPDSTDKDYWQFWGCAEVVLKFRKMCALAYRPWWNKHCRRKWCFCVLCLWFMLSSLSSFLPIVLAFPSCQSIFFQNKVCKCCIHRT